MSLYFLSRAIQALTRRIGEAARAPAFEIDPIDHPAIAAMSLTELGDLPLSPPRSAPVRRTNERTAAPAVSCPAAN